MNINLIPDKPVYFLTVPHTGTHSTRMMLDQMGVKYRFTHFQKIPEVTTEDVLDHHQVVTTYRDPFLVAASWSNRLPWSAERKRRFKGNWTRWGLFVPHAVKVFTMDELTYHKNSHHQGDISGAHAALKEENWDRYFEIVPKEVADHAQHIATEAGYFL